MTNSLEQIIETLKNENNFLVTAHVDPDGDALGSMAATGYILKNLNKTFYFFNQSGVPNKFLWMNLPAPVLTELPEDRFDWLIVLDSGDADRPGETIAELINGTKTINIDHHLGNPKFGNLNWVEPKRSSVGEMIALIAREMRINISGHLAEAVYLAIASDTGFFTYDNTTPETLEMTAELLRNGLDTAGLTHKIKSQWSLEKLHLHGRILSKAEVHCSGKVGIMDITEQDFRETGTSIEDCEGLVNYIRNISGVKVAISIREENGGKVKFSLRSHADINVQHIASSLGGGGHKNASGGILDMNINEARDLLLKKTCTLLTA
ncbi:MAG: DHH family phosphoesterase [Thermodesulfobacteriota bacterium]